MAANAKSIYIDFNLHQRLMNAYGDYGNKELIELISLGLDSIDKDSVNLLSEQAKKSIGEYVQIAKRLVKVRQEEELRGKIEGFKQENKEAQKYFDAVVSKLSSDIVKNKAILAAQIKSCPYPLLVEEFKQILRGIEYEQK